MKNSKRKRHFHKYYSQFALILFIDADSESSEDSIWSDNSPHTSDIASNPDHPPPEVVVFPPPGFVPWELIDGFVPWTIKPDSKLFQPTPESGMELYRSKIDTDTMSAKRGERLKFKNVFVDTNTLGSAFCIVGVPDFLIRPGDQFELIVTGLRRIDGTTECHDFYFSFEQVYHNDKSQILSVSNWFRSMLKQESLYR